MSKRIDIVIIIHSYMNELKIVPSGGINQNEKKTQTNENHMHAFQNF